MGWLVGLLGGLLEFVLLKEMVASILAGRTTRVLIASVLNLFCMMGVLALVMILWRNQLVASGAVMAGALITSSLYAYFKQRRTKREGD